MKQIKYMLLQNRINNGTEDKPEYEDILLEKTLGYSESAEETAKLEAYNGEYTIEDDGQPEPETEASTDDVLNAMLGVM